MTYPQRVGATGFGRALAAGLLAAFLIVALGLVAEARNPGVWDRLEGEAIAVIDGRPRIPGWRQSDAEGSLYTERDVQMLSRENRQLATRIERLRANRGHDVDILWNGHAPFYWSVVRVLDELRDRAPARYQELLMLLPRFVYDPQRLRRESGPTVAGRADGLYAIDGRADFEFFRYIALHELGHRVAGQRGDFSEAAADAYANTVLRELGYQYGYAQVQSGSHRSARRVPLGR